MRVMCRVFVLSVLLLIHLHADPLRGQHVTQEIVVSDHTGARLDGAIIIIESPQGMQLQRLTAGADGALSVVGLPQGSYGLTVSAPDFRDLRTSLSIGIGPTAPLNITLHPTSVRNEITVTARRGAIEEATESAWIVAVSEKSEMGSRPMPTVGNALDGAPGVFVQQTTYGQVSPFLRGLTGYQVLNLVDGIRFNNSTFRSGPNQYLALLEPSQAQRIESLLGPIGAQYGSDALGGVINVLSEPPAFASDRAVSTSGEWESFAASGDAAVGSSARVSVGSKRIAFVLGGAWSRHNDLRAGGGLDSHHVFRRLFGLSGDQIRSLGGDRQQDTGFTNYGGLLKLALRPAEDQSFSFSYQSGTMDRVRGYKDMWGGLGRLRSDFTPQQLNFFYARYEKLRLGWLDTVSGTFSINSQRDGTVRQNMNFSDPITTDDSKVNVFGYAAQATTHVGARHSLAFGGELYREAIRASRIETDPLSGIGRQRRPLYPNGSRYNTSGVFAQSGSEWLRKRLRTSIGARFTRVDFRSYAARNRTAAGVELGVTDEHESFEDATFNAGLTWFVNTQFRVHATAGRGFRAPNLNDLGALGLNDLGYEVPAKTAAGIGAFLGTSDGESALSTGEKVAALKPERLFDYELGMSWQHRNLYARAQVFDAELKDPIVRRTLLLSAASIPESVAGLTLHKIPQTPAQRAQGVVTVATPADPRAIKSFVNTGKAKYYGLEAVLQCVLSPYWTLDGNYSFIAGRELDPDRFVRRLPPQHGRIALRHRPTWLKGRIAWLELTADLVGAQERLSPGDITDERIGAARRRQDISDFFRGGLVSAFISPGADGRSGSADDVFRPTGETLAQIRDRVLPLGATISGVHISDDTSRVPLFLTTGGYTAVHVRSAFHLAERVSVNLAVMNLFDRNYRLHGSGLDAPGRNFYLRVRYSF